MGYTGTHEAVFADSDLLPWLERAGRERTGTRRLQDKEMTNHDSRRTRDAKGTSSRYGSEQNESTKSDHG